MLSPAAVRLRAARQALVEGARLGRYRLLQAYAIKHVPYYREAYAGRAPRTWPRVPVAATERAAAEFLWCARSSAQHAAGVPSNPDLGPLRAVLGSAGVGVAWTLVVEVVDRYNDHAWLAAPALARYRPLLSTGAVEATETAARLRDAALAALAAAPRGVLVGEPAELEEALRHAPVRRASDRGRVRLVRRSVLGTCPEPVPGRTAGPVHAVDVVHAAGLGYVGVWSAACRHVHVAAGAWRVRGSPMGPVFTRLARRDPLLLDVLAPHARDLAVGRCASGATCLERRSSRSRPRIAPRSRRGEP